MESGDNIKVAIDSKFKTEYKFGWGIREWSRQVIALFNGRKYVGPNIVYKRHQSSGGRRPIYNPSKDLQQVISVQPDGDRNISVQVQAKDGDTRTMYLFPERNLGDE